MTEALCQSNDETAAALAALALIPGLPAGGEWRVAPLASLTNRTFHVTRAGQAFVLRLPGPGTARYIDRTQEAVNAAAVASIGLAPALVHVDPASGVMLTRYIEGAVALSAERLEQPGEFRAAVGLLGRLHRSGLAFRGVMRLFPKLDEYLALARGSERSPDEIRLPELTALRREVAVLEPILGPGWGPGRPCHIDPAPHNFIAAQGRHYLLDWEYSAMCEPLWDLAGLSIEGAFDPGRDGLLLESYFGRAEKNWISRLHLYKIALRLLASSWAAVQITDANSPAAARALLDDFLPRIAEGLGAEDFGRHLASA